MFFYEWIISFYQRSVVIYLTAVQFTTFEFPAGLSLTSVASSLSFLFHRCLHSCCIFTDFSDERRKSWKSLFYKFSFESTSSFKMTSTSEWIHFFEEAGIPGNVAASYAVAFSENRMSFNILGDLNKVWTDSPCDWRARAQSWWPWP